MKLGKHLVRNAAQCNLCKDTIESTNRHDYVRCSCGEIFTDGGLEYVRGGATNLVNWIDLTEYEEHDCEENLTVSDFDHCFRFPDGQECSGVLRYCKYGDNNYCTECGWKN